MAVFLSRARLVAAVALALLPVAAQAGRSGDPDSLYRVALVNIRKDNVDARRRAVRALERASLLAPDSVAYHLELARLYYRMGFLGQARHRYERITQLQPDLAEAHLGQGLAWRRDYLKYLEPGSLRRALEEFREAARLAPRWADPWLQLVPLLVEDARLGEAMAAAERARAADPARVDGVLAVAHLAYRLGQMERADSLFHLALPSLPPPVLEKYLDIAPVASEADTAALNPLSPAERSAFIEHFWKQQDPDLATAENEAQLEYWSRVTQAYFLFYIPRRRLWDQRGEVYVRYGPPQRADYNPVGTYLHYGSGHADFPMNVLVWKYPELGMTVPMQDRLLTEYYLPPVSLTHSTDPAPDPDSLSQRSGSLATAGGRGVFAMLPPGTRPLPIDVSIARFEGDERPRMLAWLQSPGTPEDTLWGEWVVLDSTRAEVARMRRPLGLSACDPGALRATDFASELPPGRYLAGLSVRPSRGPARRGVFRSEVVLSARQAALELSDVVVSCGSPDVGGSGGPPSVRLTASPGARVEGTGPLVVYFETYNLQSGADGLSHFEYEYVVQAADPDPRIWVQRMLSPRRAIPAISAIRREQQPGSLRRQFVTVPIQSLPAGRYRIQITVRDLLAGSEAARSVVFVRQPPVRG
jgi:GWxTD domain-containing protein